MGIVLGKKYYSGTRSDLAMSFFLCPPRIVKMSSPNLNIVTLLGSCLTYSSAYLFGIQDALVGSSVEALIQVGNILGFCFGHSVEF